MSTVKEMQLTIPHGAKSVNLSIGYGDHCIHQYIDLAGAEKITLVRAPKPKAPLPKWQRALALVPTSWWAAAAARSRCSR